MQVHQIWWQGQNQIPEKYQQYQQASQQIQPLIIKTWDESSILNLLQSNYLSDLDWFQSLPLMIQKIDVAKYFILYHYGGVYIDMDMEIVKNIYPLYSETHIVMGEIPLSVVDNLFFKSLGMKGNMINNGIIFSPPKHPFWRFFLDRLKTSITSPNWFQKLFESAYVMTSAGPFALTQAVNAYHRQGIQILPSGVLETDVYSATGAKYIIHRHGMGWVSPMTRKIYYVWYHLSWVLELVIGYYLAKWIIGW